MRDSHRNINCTRADLWSCTEHSWRDVADAELTALVACRRRSVEERRLIVEETLEPGASVTRVARKHGVNAKQAFAWRSLYEQGPVEGFRQWADVAAGKRGW